MSKRITTESLTLLRKNFRDDIETIISKDEFDITKIEIQNVKYPTIKENNQSDFYNQFYLDSKNEFALAKIIYESLDLTEQQASDNLYWIYLNLNYFFKYIKERWVERENDDDDEKLSKRFENFFLALRSSQNNLIKSPIAGLWWSIHLTLDVNHPKGKYYYSKIFLSERNLRDKNVGTYQLIRDRNTLFALLEFYDENKDAEYNGERIGSEAIAQQTSKMLNQIGALTLLSYLTKEEIKDKLETYKTVILKRAYKTKRAKATSRERIQQKKIHFEEQV